MHEWTREPLVNVAEIRPSNVDKKSNTGEQPVWLCNYMDVYTREYITKDIQFMEATATSAEIQRFRVERGDVLITKDSETPDDIGIPAVVLDDIDNLVCGYHVALLKTKKDRVDPVYLSKQLATTETSHYFSRLANGSTRYGLSFGSIAATPIRLAPLPQQQRIAEILSTLDEAIEQTKALIAKTQQIRAGLVHDLFTGGVTPDGQLRPSRDEAPQLYKESPIGWIPKEWDEQLLGDLTHQVIDGTHFTPAYVEHGVPFLRVTDLQSDEIDLRSVKFISKDEHLALSKRCLPRPGDVLLSKNGTVGIAKVVDWDWEFSIFVSLCLIRPIKRLNSHFLASLFESDLIWSQIRRRSKQGTVTNLHLEEIREFLVPVPAIEEQALIAERLATLDERLRTEQTALTNFGMLKRGLMHDLLSGRVRAPIADVAEAKEVAANV